MSVMIQDLAFSPACGRREEAVERRVGHRLNVSACLVKSKRRIMPSGTGDKDSQNINNPRDLSSH